MPQERCVKKCAVYGRMWVVGEVRDIDRFEEDGTPIVTDHFRLVEEDESVEAEDLFDKDELREKQAEANRRDLGAALASAIEKIDTENDRHWTRDGRPSLQFLSGETDQNLTRAQVQAMAPDLDRETLRRDRKAEAKTIERQAS